MASILVKRRIRLVGVFPSEKSLANLATAVMLGASARPRSG